MSASSLIGNTLDSHIDTLVVGAGQAGLSVSYHLRQQGHPHVVLERDSIGASWMHRRWDSFTLVTPNWMNRLPGFPYQGKDPDGFLAREEVVNYLEEYARFFQPPVRTGVEVLSVSRPGEGDEYLIETNAGLVRARNVVIAAGFFHRQKLPEFAQRLPAHIDQVSSNDYRNPGELKPGAVIVVGSAQTGCQIAEELHRSGRRVFLCVGNAAREPRRYRGRDVNDWFNRMGGFDKSFEDPDNPVERYRANPHCSGANGGHALNLRDFAARGITLLGRMVDADASRILLADDLLENVDAADQASFKFMRAIDEYIEAQGLEVPPADEHNTDDGRPTELPRLEQIPELDLPRNGVSTIVWATGFTGDYSWIKLPILDRYGYPLQKRGVSPIPGLYFCGLHWMHCLKSGLFFGVGEAAEHVCAHLLTHRTRSQSLEAVS